MEYHIERNGSQSGPHSEEEVRSLLVRGEISENTLAWCSGMANWRPLREVLAANQSSSQLTQSVPALPKPDFAQQPTASPQNYPLASRMSRLLAMSIDHLLLLVCMLPGFILLAIKMGASCFDFADIDPEMSEDVMFALIAGFALMFFGFIVYMVVQIYLLYKRAQTLGKKWMGIQIVMHSNGEKAGLVNSFLIRSIVVGMITSIPYIGMLFGLVDICFIFREDKRCLHDLIASTSVRKLA